MNDVVAVHVAHAVTDLTHEASARFLRQYELLTDDAIEQLTTHDPVTTLVRIRR